METTEHHGLFKPNQDDDVIDTISKVSENFQKIDDLMHGKADALTSYLVEGNIYKSGMIIWNRTPVVGGNAGWINIREGRYAPAWMKTHYAVGDMVVSTTNNGHVYQCIDFGTTVRDEPVFPTEAGGIVYDLNQVPEWTPSKVYKIGDYVVSNDGNKAYHYECLVNGTSGTTEPEWRTFTAGETLDGSIAWVTRKTVVWKEIGSSCEFREFGSIL